MGGALAQNHNERKHCLRQQWCVNWHDYSCAVNSITCTPTRTSAKPIYMHRFPPPKYQKNIIDSPVSPHPLADEGAPPLLYGPAETNTRRHKMIPEGRHGTSISIYFFCLSALPPVVYAWHIIMKPPKKHSYLSAVIFRQDVRYQYTTSYYTV